MYFKQSSEITLLPCASAGIEWEYINVLEVQGHTSFSCPPRPHSLFPISRVQERANAGRPQPYSTSGASLILSVPFYFSTAPIRGETAWAFSLC